MNRDRRTVRDSIQMAVSLAEAMGSKLVKHPILLAADEPREAGYTYENFQGGTFLFLRVDERGNRYHPFGNVGLSHADFWQAGCFALKCMDEKAYLEKKAVAAKEAAKVA